MKNILRTQLILLLSKSSILVGGQAVIEGVMMRVPGFIATAVRNPEGEIIVKRKAFDTLVQKHQYLNLPIVRGAISLFESMKMGFSTIQWSANIAFPEETKKENKILDFLMTIASIALAISLFIWLPLATATWFIERPEEDAFIYNLIAGIVRISIFLIYLISISYTKDAKRLFEYHGAEHKVVYTFENGDDLNVENARKYPTPHPRCGTSFMFIVMLVAIFSFMILDKIYIEQFTYFLGPINVPKRLLMHLLFIPLVSGLGYEVLKFSSKYKNNFLLNYFIQPGLWLQKITTKPPDDSQLEVSIKALTSAFGDSFNKYKGKKHIADAIE